MSGPGVIIRKPSGRGSSRVILALTSFARISGRLRVIPQHAVQPSASSHSHPAGCLPPGRITAGACCVIARLRHFLSEILGAVFRPLRRPIQRIAFQPLQKSFRGCAQAFHFYLSAGVPGLVALSDGHRVERKEKTCPTREGSNLTRYGAKAS